MDVVFGGIMKFKESNLCLLMLFGITRYCYFSLGEGI